MSIALAWRSVWITARKGKRTNRRRGRYRVCWIDDSGRQRSLSYRSKSTAETARTLKERELNSWAVPQGVRTWPELLTDYGMALATASRAHREMMSRVLLRFYQICRPTFSNRITPAMCDKFMAARGAGLPLDEKGKTAKVGDETLRRDHRMLSAFFGWCVHRHYMEESPMASVRPPGRVRRTRQAPREKDWLALLEVLNREDLAVHDPQAWHLMILLGVVTGYRQSVLLHTYFGVDVFNRKSLDLLETKHRRDGGFAVVRLAETEDGIGLLHTFSGKTLKEQIVGIPKVVNDRIGVRIGELTAGVSRLFAWARWQRKAWERINKAAKLRISFHKLRAAAGTRAAVARAEQAAAAILDHSSAMMTREHYLDQAQVAAAVALGQSLPELPPMPSYGDRSAIRSMPGRRPTDNAPSGPPGRTEGPARGDASQPAC